MSTDEIYVTSVLPFAITFDDESIINPWGAKFTKSKYEAFKSACVLTCCYGELISAEKCDSIKFPPNIINLTLYKSWFCYKYEHKDNKREIFSKIPDNLPKSLKNIYANYGSLKSINKLHDNLEHFECFLNNISSITCEFPASLQYINCGVNNIITLPNTRNIRHLNCYTNKITFIDADDLSDAENPINKKLKSFLSSGNIIAELPKIPTTLKRLDIAFNKITSLDTLPYALPSTLHYLKCSHNRLTSLTLKDMPLMKHINAADNNLSSFIIGNMPMLEYLDLSKNNLGYLVENLPVKIKKIIINNNNIASLPYLLDFTKLNELIINNNKLVELPDLPIKISKLDISKNNIKYISRHNIEKIKLIISNTYCYSGTDSEYHIDILDNPFSESSVGLSAFAKYNKLKECISGFCSD